MSTELNLGEVLIVNRRYHLKGIKPPCSLPLDGLAPGTRSKEIELAGPLRLDEFSISSSDQLTLGYFPSFERANGCIQMWGRLCFSWTLAGLFSFRTSFSVGLLLWRADKDLNSQASTPVLGFPFWSLAMLKSHASKGTLLPNLTHSNHLLLSIRYCISSSYTFPGMVLKLPGAVSWSTCELDSMAAGHKWTWFLILTDLYQFVSMENFLSIPTSVPSLIDK